MGWWGPGRCGWAGSGSGRPHRRRWALQRKARLLTAIPPGAHWRPWPPPGVTETAPALDSAFLPAVLEEGTSTSSMTRTAR